MRNYAETTPYQLQAELDDASVVSEDPNMGVKLVVYTAASHVSEVNLDMFFTSALNTTDGGGCIETEFCFS